MSHKEKPQGAGEFVTHAYNLEDQKSMLDFYGKWAEDYDNQMEEGLGYSSPWMVTALFSAYVRNKNASVLDIGCGTGLTSKYLHEAGFTNLHGIDISEEMLVVAKKRQIYSSLHAADLNHPLNFLNDQFHGAISSGTFTHGHVGPEPISEVFRVIESGGFFACTVHMELWESRGFKNRFEELERSGQIQCLSRKMDRYFDNGEPEGWFCLYQKN